MRILVTGGAGFIGSHLVDAFVAAGHTVAILDNYSTGKKENHPADVRVFQGDITDTAFVQQTIKEFQPEIISHHAAQISVSVSAREPILDAEQNIIGTINILEAGKQVGCVKKIIFSSSAGTVYGEVASLPADESFPILPVSPYGLSKYVAEEYIGLYTRTTALKSTILRYGNVYGPRQDPHGEAGVCAIFAKKMVAGEPCTIFGDGKLQRDYIYVKDVAAANVLALTKGDGKAVNISSGEGKNVLEIFAALKEAADYSLEPVFGPPRPGDAESNYHSPQKAKEVLGWEPTTSFNEGIKETYQWFQEA